MVQMEEQILLMDNITVIYPNGFAATKNVRLACNRGSIHALLGETARARHLNEGAVRLNHAHRGADLFKGKPIQFVIHWTPFSMVWAWFISILC